MDDVNRAGRMSQRTSFPRNLVTYAYGTVRYTVLEYRQSKCRQTICSQETKVLLVVLITTPVLVVHME